MNISYNWLKEYVGSLPKPEKLADLLTMHSFEVEDVKKKGSDYILSIDILPNRAHDCLSYIGIAREVAALTDKKLQIPRIKLRESSMPTKDFVRVDIKEKSLCLRYSARVITDIKVKDSPKWLKDKLQTMGQKSINNIVDATNYIMFEMGQPLHAFDFDKVSGKKIIVRKGKKGEKMTTLDNEVCRLDNDILVIADEKNPLALAGVKGGKKAEIGHNTKTIVLEAANFDISAIRKTNRKTNIETESSFRFGYGLDPDLTKEAINRVAGLIQEISGGKVMKGTVDVYADKPRVKKIKLNLEKINNILGVKITKREVARRLKSLGFLIDSSLVVTVPSFRIDVEIEEDLIEEIARMIGYESMPANYPLGLVSGVKKDEEIILESKIKNIMEGFGFTELYNFSFIGEKDIDNFNLNENNHLELENPLSLELKYLRRNLLVGLINKIKYNLNLIGEEEIRIFEVGKVYRKERKGIIEHMLFDGLIYMPSKKQKESFYELKGTIDGLLDKIGISEHWYDDFEATPEWSDNVFWQKNGTAEIKMGDNEKIGFLGNINPVILKKLGIEGSLVGFNIDFEKLLNLSEEELIYQKPSPYPSVVRDLSLIINTEDRAAHVLNEINRAGGELVVDVDLFDIYEGDNVPEGKKSLAFHIIYQSYKKTLNDKEVD
ncbi:MAG: phenylalanine--tRNA ligase subunit beta, partial [Candidatus Portnoybacteria bacterium]|nr:phenylalanine--tRNA ligase subunit beta [Candidatus Portnoybacteria bacterium]